MGKNLWCSDCNKPFNIFRWKKQCHCCGKIVCSACLKKGPYLVREWSFYFDNNRTYLLCNDCFNKAFIPCPDCNKPTGIYSEKVSIANEQYSILGVLAPPKERIADDNIYQPRCQFCIRTLCLECLKCLPRMEWLAWNPFGDKVDRICNKCWGEIVLPVKKHYEEILRSYNKVDTFPKTYRGKIPIVAGSQKDIITTNWFQEKENALKMLKFSSLYNGCDIVYDVQWEKQTGSTGNYYYTEWRANGIPAKRR